VIIGGGDTGADCLGTAHRQGARSVYQFELLSMPPQDRAPDNPWPLWPNIFRVSSAHEEGGTQEFCISTKRFSGQNRRVERLHAVKVEFVPGGGNGRLIFDLGAAGFKNALDLASASENLEVKDGKLALADPAKAGTLTLDFKLPYAYGDAWVEKPLPEKGLKLALNDTQVYPGGAGVDDGQRIRLFDLVRGRSGFTLKATLEAGAAPLEQFKAVGAFHLAHTVLPAVLKGHSWHPCPFLLWSKYCRPDGAARFTERECARGSLGRFPAVEAMALMLANAQKMKKFGA
jgi:hypothetical protein